MRKKSMTLLVVGVMALPAVADGHKRDRVAGSGAAAKACKAERAADAAAFKAEYANENGKRAFRRCVRQRVRAARKACRAEREADPAAAFKAKYANENGKHAGRRCVRQNAGTTV